MRPAVFIDRDGTIIEEAGYLDRLDRIVFFPYAVDAVRLLKRAGFAVVVVTNQAGVGRGIYAEQFVHETHAVIAARPTAPAGALARAHLQRGDALEHLGRRTEAAEAYRTAIATAGARDPLGIAARARAAIRAQR